MKASAEVALLSPASAPEGQEVEWGFYKSTVDGSKKITTGFLQGSIAHGVGLKPAPTRNSSLQALGRVRGGSSGLQDTSLSSKP